MQKPDTDASVLEQPAKSFDTIPKRVSAWLAIIVILLGGISWLFGIKETSDTANANAQAAKEQSARTAAALEDKASKADVQAMRQEIREDFQDVKRDLRELRRSSENAATARLPRPKLVRPTPE